MELLIVVIGGNHRLKALKLLGADFNLGKEDEGLSPHLAACCLRGNLYGGYYLMKIISSPPEKAGLVERQSGRPPLTGLGT